MNFKQLLDRYLTSPPHDPFGEFYEDVCENFTEEFWAEAELWYETEQAQQLVEKAYEKYHVKHIHNPARWNECAKETAGKIQRIYSLYKLNQDVRPTILPDTAGAGTADAGAILRWKPGIRTV